MTAYFVANNGAQTGPFTIEDIRARCASGEIGRQTLMWREGLAEWQSAERVLHDAGVRFADDAQPPPLSPVDAAASGWRFEVPGVALAAGRGLQWIGEGWGLFKAAPGLWIVAMLIWFGIQMVMGCVPFLGGLASLLLGPSFMVGLLAFAHGIARNGKADLADLFAGFKARLSTLVVLSLLYLLMVLGVIAVGCVALFILAGGAAVFQSADPAQAVAALFTGDRLLVAVLIGLLMLALLLLVACAYWYAPGLVFYANQTAGSALRQSFIACWRNWLPLLVFGLLAMVITLLGALPFGLGLLVVLPVLMAGSYASFRDIFGRQS
ncbi:MAG: DUF4339 domain-containing protein [Nevskiaceae bacterium]|nr:MAG: DUF4339 domain-containing protein [Nevskiaceae bacterium]